MVLHTSARLDGCAFDDDVGARDEAARIALWLGDDVHQRGAGHRGDC